MGIFALNYEVIENKARGIMLLYSTILSIRETLTKEVFLNLVIKWNLESPHKENIITINEQI